MKEIENEDFKRGYVEFYNELVNFLQLSGKMKLDMRQFSTLMLNFVSERDYLIESWGFEEEEKEAK